jgi:5-methylcytosine-specific restriction endonuclease McrA
MSKYQHLYDKKICYFCGLKEPDSIKKGFRRLIELHHIVERNQGGSNEESNLIPCCSTCHSKIHLNLIKIDKWYNFGYKWKLKWSNEKGDVFGPYTE